LSKNIIAARYRRVSPDGVAPSPLQASADSVADLSADSTFAGSAGSRPIVVIGDVGVGKTSFFENLYESLDQADKSDTYFIHINLGIKANLSADVKTYVLAEIPAALKGKYGVDIDHLDFVNAITIPNYVILTAVCEGR
jgi:hypothetical protein